MKTVQTKRKRLDEILLAEGNIDQEQILEALMRQKAHGGRFGTQLLYYRYVDERNLVRALTIQLNCAGIVLSDTKIDENVIKMLPVKHAVARKIIPFKYDEKSNTLSIACEDPTDLTLINDTNYLVQGKNIKLYVATELAIDAAINKYYLGRDINLEDSLSLELPDLTLINDLPDESDDERIRRDKQAPGKSVLIITDEEYSGSLFQSVLERDKFEVAIYDTCDKALTLIEERNFHAILIKKSVPDDHKKLTDRLRKISPRTKIRLFDTSSSLLWDDQPDNLTDSILRQNLDLFLSMMASRENINENHSGTVGRYVYKLCCKLGLCGQDRAVITNAAYIHDLTRYYYRANDTSDYASLIKKTIKLSESVNFPLVMTDMLKAMYQDLRPEYKKTLPLEILGGNILTIVDLFCENVQLNQKLTLEKFEAVKKRLRDYSNKLFLPDVVEAFIGMVQEEVLFFQTSGISTQIMLYSNDQEASHPLELRLKNENFIVISESSSDSFLNLYHRSRPDILALVIKGNPAQVSKKINEFSQKGVNYKQTPTILLAETRVLSEAATFFDQGIKDVIALDGNHDLLVVQLKKIHTRLIEQAKQKNDPDGKFAGASGRLSDINLIDLIQALGPGRKTVKITITGETLSQDKVIIYLKRGSIIFAKTNSLSGADAVYEGMAWTDGRWQVEPVEETDLPEPNITLSNDSILMQGAYQLDEKMKAGKL
ncbi:MAG: DUF4388 domain-containing protein [Candidatus Zixiibacteriota bacterium]